MKTKNSFQTGLLIGLGVLLIADAILSPNESKKTAPRQSENPISIQDKIAKLNRQRIAAVADEKYEVAARLRDEILQLKSKCDVI